MKKLLTLLTMALFVIGCASTSPSSNVTQAAPAELDFGDYTSVTLMVKAWDSLGAGQYKTAVKYTEKCAELYEEEAREMQASMTARAPHDKINEYWALNDVGTCYFIRGKALAQLGKNDEALAAYKVVKEELFYAQAWDPKGWYWSPATAAAPEIIHLSNDF